MSWNKGKSPSDKTRKKISKTHKINGKKPPSQKGKHWILSSETKARQKIAQQKIWDSSDGKKRKIKYKLINTGTNNPRFNFKMTDEAKEKQRIFFLNMWKNMSEETKKERSKKISFSRLGDKNPAKREDVKEKIRQARANQKFTKISKIEITLNEKLKVVGINTIPQYVIKTKGFVTSVDLYIKDKKLCVYCDGDYWHNLPNAQKRDKRANKMLKKLGYKVLRFWEREINKSPETCVNKIMNYYNN